jgi:hypothetical protein
LDAIRTNLAYSCACPHVEAQLFAVLGLALNTGSRLRNLDVLIFLMLEAQPIGERHCGACEVKRLTHRVLIGFDHRREHGESVYDPDRGCDLTRRLTFTDGDKLSELVQRGNLICMEVGRFTLSYEIVAGRGAGVASPHGEALCETSGLK